MTFSDPSPQCSRVTGWTACLAVCLAALFVSGCKGGADVLIDQPLPTPLVEKLPLTVGLYLSPELISFVHEETIDEKSEWRLDLGPSQKMMFENLLTGMFREMTLVKEPTGNTTVDAVLSPSIEEFQMAIPKQTFSTFYEVWIRYQMKLTTNDGELLGEWPLTAYGNANARDYTFMESEKKPALRKAAYEAVRDAMAFFALQFRTVPEVKDWLTQALPEPPK